MAVTEVASWDYKGMKLLITHVQNLSQFQYDEIVAKSGFAMPNLLDLVSGHHCGYVRTDIQLDEETYNSLDVHGGLTWHEAHEDGTFTYGFDCHHCASNGQMDTIQKWNVDRVMQECHSLADQLFDLSIAERISPDK